MLAVVVGACIAVPPPLALPAGDGLDADDVMDVASDTGGAEVLDAVVLACPFGCVDGAELVARVVVGGDGHACVLSDRNDLYCLGSLANGALGVGVLREAELAPARVALDDVRALAAGRRHTCAVVGADARVACWGDNTERQVEPQRAVDRWDFHAAPVDVAVNGVTALALGDASTCALVDANIAATDASDTPSLERALVCWGRRLAPAGTVPSTTEPIAIGGLGGLDLGHVALGDDHACVASTDGADVRCFGRGELGQLGDGGLASSHSAIAVHAALPLPISELAAAADYTCALVANNTRVACWGATPLGAWLVPTLIAATFDPPLVALVAGDGLACGIDSDGVAHCWGDNAANRIPISGLILAAEPVALPALPPLASLAINTHALCATTRAGELLCWGDGAPSLTPAAVQHDPAAVTRRACSASPEVLAPCTTCADGALAGCAFGCADGRCREVVEAHVGTSFECFRLDDGDVVCGGSASDDGELGLGPLTPFVHYRHASVALPAPASALAGGAQHTCAVVSGALACWGHNAYGELGVGDREPRDRPTAVPLSGVRLVAAYTDQTCASDGAAVWCWGRPLDLQGPQLLTPTLQEWPAGIALGEITQLALGQGFACLVSRDQTAHERVWCWGANGDKQVAPGASLAAELTLRAEGTFASLALGRGAGCLVMLSGEARALHCWGSDFDAIVPIGGHALVDLSARFPAPVAGVDLFRRFACAALVDGRVACWGRGDQGERFALGGDLPEPGAPAISPTLGATRTLSVGLSGACATDDAGLARCWGAGICGTPPWRPNPMACAEPQLVGDLEPWP